MSCIFISNAHAKHQAGGLAQPFFLVHAERVWEEAIE